jgi:hypothetical protein
LSTIEIILGIILLLLILAMGDIKKKIIGLIIFAAIVIEKLLR